MTSTTSIYGELPITGYIRQSQLIPRLFLFVRDPLAQGQGRGLSSTHQTVGTHYRVAGGRHSRLDGDAQCDNRQNRQSLIQEVNVI